jgi:hypothetical protein
VGTNKCLVRQLLCLYPFPHLSHLRSFGCIFLPEDGWPSLALLMRDLLKALSSSSISSFWSSSIALSSFSDFRFNINDNLWLGRLLGGVASPAYFPPFPLDIVFLRDDIEIGIAREESPTSLATAATAAAFAVLAETLFRRVTRWVGLREPADIECE